MIFEPTPSVRNEWRLYQLEGHARSTGHFCGILIVQDMFAPEGLLNAWRKLGKKAGVMRRPEGPRGFEVFGVMFTFFVFC